MNNISNRPDSNYPPMSDSEWANAPFNEEDYPTKEINVVCSQILSKTAEIEAEYDKYTGKLIYENIQSDYYDQHKTPLDLIEEFYTVLKTKKFPKDIDYWIQECKQWFNDDTSIEEA